MKCLIFATAALLLARKLISWVSARAMERHLSLSDECLGRIRALDSEAAPEAVGTAPSQPWRDIQ